MYNIDYATKKILRTHPNLVGKQMNLLVVAGSNAYGTNKDDSDLDLRGICENGAEDVLGLKETTVAIVNEETDLTVYSLYKIFRLLLKQNPNTLELLNCKRQNYLQLDYVGEELLASRQIFISKGMYNSFGGYVKAQFHKMENNNKGLEKQCKNIMHLLRLLYTCREAFETGEIVTYREKEHDTLMWARGKECLTEDGKPTDELKKIIAQAQLDLDNALLKTKIPEHLDYKKIARLYNRLNSYNIERGNILWG